MKVTYSDPFHYTNKRLEIPSNVFLSQLVDYEFTDNIKNTYKFIGKNIESAKVYYNFIVPKGLYYIFIDKDLRKRILPSNLSIKYKYKKYQIPVYLPYMFFTLVFVLSEFQPEPRNLYVYATDKTHTYFYNFPLPNVYNDGKVCQNSIIPIGIHYQDNELLFKKSSLEISYHYIDLFFNSTFNTDLFESSISFFEGLDLKPSDYYYKCYQQNTNYFKYLDDLFENKIYQVKRRNHPFHGYQYTTVPSDVLFHGYITNSMYQNNFNDQKINRIVLNPSTDEIFYLYDKIKFNNKEYILCGFSPHITNSKILYNITKKENEPNMKKIGSSYYIKLFDISNKKYIKLTLDDIVLNSYEIEHVE